jgi:16S rRNA (guanine(527)-N(7))-methyltransferase RsmG
MTASQFAKAAEEYGISLTDGQLEAFTVFEDRLYEANKSKNLTRVPRSECKPRHFLDSLSLSPLIPEGSSVVDLGTGAGFPGVPLAIARPDLRVTLLDAAEKEVRFLESLADIVTVGLILERAEIAARMTEFRERYDVATGRALAPLPIQAEISAGFVRVGGLFLPQRMEQEETPEYGDLGLTLDRRELIEAQGAKRLIPVYRKTEPTPDRFPRTWAAIKKRSL